MPSHQAFPLSPKEVSADQRGQALWPVLHSMPGAGPGGDIYVQPGISPVMLLVAHLP